MSSVFEGHYPPSRPLRFFEEISAIPRPSGNEAAIAGYMERFARERGLSVVQDALHNVVIKKPASKGMEGKKPLILQGHLDMVPDVRAGVQHDWTKDGIELVLNGNILTANGTTLGGDDGIALGYMLSVLDDDSLVHPPLICVMTVMEEVGLIGASKMDPAVFRETDRMIGLDAGAEGKFLVSSAAGATVCFRLPFETEAAEGEAYTLKLSGLKGGHSGKDINLERGNANKLLARILFELGKELSFRIVSMEGGSKNNAIPREAEAVIAIAPGQGEKLRAVTAETMKNLATELQFSDNAPQLEICPSKAERMMDKASSEKLLYLTHVMPNGVMMMNLSLEDMVNGSLNFGVLRTNESQVYGEISIRSAENSIIESIMDVVLHILDGQGAAHEVKESYPAFAYRAESKMMELAARACKEVIGIEGKPYILHAGTEMGIFRSYHPELDCISLGPDKGAVHSPDEWLDVDSYLRNYQVLVRILELLCE